MRTPKQLKDMIEVFLYSAIKWPEENNIELKNFAQAIEDLIDEKIRIHGSNL
jgi:hypothetical protein